MIFLRTTGPARFYASLATVTAAGCFCSVRAAAGAVAIGRGGEKAPGNAALVLIRAVHGVALGRIGFRGVVDAFGVILSPVAREYAIPACAARGRPTTRADREAFIRVLVAVVVDIIAYAVIEAYDAVTLTRVDRRVIVGAVACHRAG